MNDTHYEKFGYCHFHSVLNTAEISQFRSQVNEFYSNCIEFPLEPKKCLQIQEIMEIAFSSKLVDSIKSAFHSDYIMFPDLEVQYNLIGGATQNGIFSGWHVDSNSEGLKEYLADRNYGFAKVGVYFQDNNSKYAGGIDLVPSSHKFPQIGSLKSRILLKKLINKLQIVFKAKTVKSKAGDALIFDSRLQHRSTRLNAKVGHNSFKKNNLGDVVDLPAGREKVVIYFDIAYPNSYRDFWNNAQKRAMSKDYLESRHFSGYTDPNGDYDLFRKYAAAQKVRTIFDVLEQE